MDADEPAAPLAIDPSPVLLDPFNDRIDDRPGGKSLHVITPSHGNRSVVS